MTDADVDGAHITDAASDLLLPADARGDRGGLPLHRATAALQGEPGQVRGLHQGPGGPRGLPDRAGDRGGGAAPAKRRRDRGQGSGPRGRGRAQLQAYPRSLPDAITRANILEQAAIGGAFDPGRADADLSAWQTRWRSGWTLSRWNTNAAGRGGSRKITAFACPASCAGSEEIRTLDGAVLRSGEAGNSPRSAADSRTVYVRFRAAMPARPRAADQRGDELLTAILEGRQQGAAMQRTRAGEMEPEPLWETRWTRGSGDACWVKVDDLCRGG